MTVIFFEPLHPPDVLCHRQRLRTDRGVFRKVEPMMEEPGRQACFGLAFQLQQCSQLVTLIVVLAVRRSA
jgi:hypothetical protein